MEATLHCRARWAERFPEEPARALEVRFSRAKVPGKGTRRRIEASWKAMGTGGPRRAFRNGAYLLVHGDSCFVVAPGEKVLTVYRG